MKAHLSIDTREDCPEENSGAYPVLVFRCSTCGTELTKPIEERMKDRRQFADLWHPWEKTDYTGASKITNCEYSGKFFDGPLVELREVTGK